VWNKPKQQWELDPTAFVENPKFNDAVQKAITKYCYDSPALQEQADKVRTGWMGVVDIRTPYPDSRRPVEDIFGFAACRDGSPGL
jgi:hypothetical protein